MPLDPVSGLQSPPGTFINLYANTYTVTVSDANNCTITTSVTVNQNPEIVFTTLDYTEPVCHGDENGSVNFSAIGGVGALTYAFDGGAYNNITTYGNLAAGFYNISVQDNLGCIKDTLFELTEPDPVGIESITLSALTCLTASDGKAIIEANGGRGNYTYYVRPGLRINKTGIFSGFAQGLYTITIMDTSRCQFDSTFIISPPANPIRTEITKKDLSCFGFGNEGYAEVQVYGGMAPYVYMWNSDPAQTSARASGLRFGWYWVDVVDANGCTISDSTYVNPAPCCDEVFIPNAFSPNGDGQNDEFRILSSAGIELQQFEVYNRWGQKVWGTHTYHKGWNGKHLGEEVPVDTYYYVFRYKCATDGRDYTKKGDIIVVR